MVTPASNVHLLAPGTPPAESARLPVALRERMGLAPEAVSFASILDRELTREEVLSRIDEDVLRSAPLNLLVTTAIAISGGQAAELTEDAVLRFSTALTNPHEGPEAYVRLTAEKLVLSDVEYQAAIAAYAAAESAQPVLEQWKNQQHYLDACKVHERRMDRLLRARKEAFERYERAAEVYRTAVLTRDGQEILLRARRTTPPIEVSSTPVQPNGVRVLLR